MSKVSTGGMRSSAQARAAGRAFFFRYRPFVSIIAAPQSLGVIRPVLPP
jgi:hypothetical protein